MSPIPSIVSCSVTLLLVTALAGCNASRADADAPLTPEEQAAAEAKANQLMGVSLGEFVVRDFHPAEGVRSALRFELYAQVRQADLAKFEAVLVNRRHKLRNQVITASRTAAVSDFDDPELLMIRKRILLRIRRAMPGLPLADVVLTDYEFSLDE